MYVKTLSKGENMVSCEMVVPSNSPWAIIPNFAICFYSTIRFPFILTNFVYRFYLYPQGF